MGCCPLQVTPLHYDPHHNLLAQVVGRKYVRLYSPELTEQLSPYESGHNTNSSQVSAYYNSELQRDSIHVVICSVEKVAAILVRQGKDQTRYV